MKKRKLKTTGMIKFGKEIKETVYRFDIEYDNKIEKPLLDWAKKRIIKDKEALLNYAINGILREMIEKKEKHE